MSHATVLVAIKPTDDIAAAIAEQMAPFDENNECFADGSRWDWYSIGGRWDGLMVEGNVLAVGKIHPNHFQAKRLKDAEESWEEFAKEQPDMRGFLWQCAPNISREQFIADRTQGWFPAHHAFLSNYRWHEQSRMGWFGCEAKTECEIKSGGAPNIHRCQTTSKNDEEAQIVSWGDDKPTWEFKFYDRFIQPLDPKILLVTVDYHV